MHSDAYKDIKTPKLIWGGAFKHDKLTALVLGCKAIVSRYNFEASTVRGIAICSILVVSLFV